MQRLARKGESEICRRPTKDGLWWKEEPQRTA